MTLIWNVHIPKLSSLNLSKCPKSRIRSFLNVKARIKYVIVEQSSYFNGDRKKIVLIYEEIEHKNMQYVNATIYKI
jgi:hypothetical protein